MSGKLRTAAREAGCNFANHYRMARGFAARGQGRSAWAHAALAATYHALMQSRRKAARASRLFAEAKQEETAILALARDLGVR